MATDPYLDDEQQGGGFNPADLLRTFVRRKWLFIVPFGLCLGMAFVAIRTMEPVYYAGGQIKVLTEQTASRTLSEGMPRYTRSKEADAETMVLIRSIITSPRFLDRLVRDLDLQSSDLLTAQDRLDIQAAGRDPVEALVSSLNRWIRIDNDDTHIFRIGVRHSDPDHAYKLAQEILTRFVQEEQESRQSRSTTTRDFLTEQRENYERNLTEAQRRLTSYQRSMLSSALAGNPVSEQNLAQAEIARSRLERQARDNRQQVLPQRLSESRAVLPASEQLAAQVRAEPEFAGFVREMIGLEIAAEEAQLTGARTAVEQQNFVGTKRLELDTKLRARVRAEYPSLAAAGQGAVSQYIFWLLYADVHDAVARAVAGYVQDYRNFMTRQPEQAATLAGLQRDVEAAQDLLRTIGQDINRENISLAASMSEIGYRIEVYRNPRRPGAPIEPDKNKLSLMGFALALALGVGLVVVAEMMDRSFKSVRQIERTLGLKVIGTLPVVTDGAPFAKVRRRRILLWILIVVSILALAAVGFLWLYPRLA
ncbi:MAG: hypothetical protein IPM94_04480 [bacterium]|nr:hypothetical protein [bacterium]